jgi:1,4-alpha-glucan branching enzyme
MTMTTATITDRSLFTDNDLHWFNEGTHLRLYDKLGSRPWVHDGQQGVHFGVWAPNASSVHVMGDFNGWSKDAAPLTLRASSGIWEGFLPGLRPGARYKYHIRARHSGYTVDKADPYAYHTEVPPQTSGYVWALDYQWQDRQWMRNRYQRHGTDAPISIYEVHLGSWLRSAQDAGSFDSYRSLAPRLAQYVRDHGFTHVEFLPLMEHPFYGSWGY